jgi:hypothetical protein
MSFPVPNNATCADFQGSAGTCTGTSEEFTVSNAGVKNLCWSFNFGTANNMGYYTWVSGKEKRDGNETEEVAVRRNPVAFEA